MLNKLKLVLQIFMVLLASSGLQLLATVSQLFRVGFYVLDAFLKLEFDLVGKSGIFFELIGFELFDQRLFILFAAAAVLFGLLADL